MTLTTGEREAVQWLSRGATIKDTARHMHRRVWAVNALLERARRENGCETTYQLMYMFGRDSSAPLAKGAER
jgi:DNA-binding CsgD family transcriptional regulator